MLKKPRRIYSDFANDRERAVVMAMTRRETKQNIMVGIDPRWDEERRTKNTYNTRWKSL